jgi:hypothetical protein
MDEFEKEEIPLAGQPTIPQAANPPAGGEPPQPSEPPWNIDWVDTFYRECGREVTLAYTTLNQMKNWAMTIAAAALSGLAFGTSSASYPNKYMFVGVVIVYVFVLRFYVRAILCYINLVRWNKLQSDCVELRLLPRRVKNNDPPKTRMALEGQFKEDLQNYYFRWLSPIDRKTQLLSNLKLGFGLVFALTIFFFLWGLINLWQERLVKALLVFSVGTTIVELNDFFKSSFFDTVAASQQRKTWSKAHEMFPVPGSRGWYLTSWILVIGLSVTFAEWPAIGRWLQTLLCRI